MIKMPTDQNVCAAPAVVAGVTVTESKPDPEPEPKLDGRRHNRPAAPPKKNHPWRRRTKRGP